MTLRGGTNHYNIKFLSGYWLFCHSKIILTNGNSPFSETQEKEEWFITNLSYEKIVLSGKGYRACYANVHHLKNRINNRIILK